MQQWTNPLFEVEQGKQVGKRPKLERFKDEAAIFLGRTGHDSPDTG